ncbi:peptidoglycan recognition protein [Streptomyces sp. NPDC092296]|uniref:peptidoglycan recognition protein family protein n=1 Tax=Streptomyces sp. NPDC092296 TaxID=3366012 RepID=UPI003812A42F
MGSRNTHAHRPLGFKGRVWLGLGTVLIGGAGVSAVAFASETEPVHHRAAHAPVTPRLFHNALTELPADAAPAGRARTAGKHVRERGLTRRATQPFNLLGVSWDSARTEIGAAVQVRTRSLETRQWSAWTDIETSDSAPDPGGREATGARGATEPLWTGPSDGVEVRVVPGSGTRKLPDGLRLDLVASGDLPTGDGSAAPSAEAAAPRGGAGTTLADAEPAAATAPAPSVCTSTGTTATVPAKPVSSAPQPAIVNRQQWGADESLRDQTLPCYSTDGVKVVFVHHTADSNDYVCTTDPTDPNGSAARVQAEYAYHVKSEGWRDVGYNFLVDKCGTIFEGRWGGVDNGGGEWLPVFGAHTYGFNAGTMGVAVLGTYTSTAADPAVLSALAKLANWKLGMYGIAPDSKVTMVEMGTDDVSKKTQRYPYGTAVSLDAISGHSDAYVTECPGTQLYAQLPAIRTLAATGPAPVAVPAPVLGTLTGAVKSGSTWYTTGKVTVPWSESWPSGEFSRFEVLVDGKVAASPAATARSAAVTLAAGKHTVAVRAVHVQGKTATSAAATVLADSTKPVFNTAPNMQLRAGTVNATAIPVTLTWKATDKQLLKSVAVTGPTAKTFAPATTSWATTAKPGASRKWSFKAADVAGNSTTASVARTPVIYQESAAAKTGKWTKRKSSSYLGGASYSSNSKNASLTWTFTGRSVMWLVSRATDSGKVTVYVDGKKIGTYDVKASKTMYRQGVWGKNWSTSGKHKLKIVIQATKGRPTVTTDGIAVLK